jgi:SAM-dependent methyltransferase
VSARATSPPTDSAVIWHDVECGAYDGDLRLWEELAAGHPGALLELGAGTGRVALHLARRGHEVVAVEREEALAAELASRAQAERLPIEVIAADARELALGRRFGLILAPMQFLQLFLDADQRRSVLAGCGSHLAPGGVLAAALIDGIPDGILPPGPDEAKPLPDLREIGGVVYSSLPLGVSVRGGVIESERRRERVAADGAIDAARHVDRLALVEIDGVEAEAAAAGLHPVRRVEVGATDSHVGSTVLILEGAA